MPQSAEAQERTIEYELTDKQSLAWNHLVKDKSNFILYGGAKGGGKSFLLVLWVYHWTKKLITFLGLDEEKVEYPIPVGFIGRKRSTDFTKTTLETWKQIIPSTSYLIREQDKEIVIDEKVKIFFGGLDDELNINKFNSAELAFCAIDQAEETERNDVSVLLASLRLKHKGKQPPYKRLFTANPAECWLKEDFIANLRSSHYFIPALPHENPYLPTGYIQTLEESFAHDEQLLRAYRDGDWDVMTAENVIIPPMYLEALKMTVHTPRFVRKCIACDPATGGDECMIYALENGEIIDERILHYDDTMKIVGEIMILAEKHKIKDIFVDSIGIGKGIVDRLQELGKHVIAINSAEKAKDDVRFFNKRAEMWWKVRELVMDKNIPYPEDEELRRQLSAVRYSVVDSSGKIKLEPKEKTKERLGKSPDRADAFVYGNHQLQQIGQRKSIDDYHLRRANLEVDKAMEGIRGY